MVGYGKSMLKARRQGWESAYLNYDGLKGDLARIENNNSVREEDEETRLLLADRTAEPPIDYLDAWKVGFFDKMRLEIEKISLFTVKQQGKLADAIGSLRFPSHGVFDANVKGLTRGKTSLDSYAIYAIELTHLFKFVCINSIGLKKILKKYGKIFAKLDEPDYYVFESDHLKQLANSEGMTSIHSSLRAAMAMEFDSSGESSLALLRLKYIMACASIIQKNANIFQMPFIEFLSKKAMIAPETNFGGMDKRGKRALQWLIDLNPEHILKLDAVQLQAMWNGWASETEIVRAFLDSGSPSHRRLPTLTGDIASELMTQATYAPEVEDGPKDQKLGWGGADGTSMILNLCSILLYTINYYIVAPTANHYAIGLGYNGAFGASLIGASSFSAMFSAFLYSLWFTRSSFKSALIFSAFCPLLGNLMYGLAISYDSMPTAIIGRILCGFGSAEVLNRQLIATSVSFDFTTRASALFVAFGASGMSIGPLIAGILDNTAGRDYRVDIPLPFTPAKGIIWNHVTAPGFVMALFWSIQLFCLVFLFQEPRRINTVSTESDGGDKVGTQSTKAIGQDGIENSQAHSAETPFSGYGSLLSSEVESDTQTTSAFTGPIDLWREIRSTCALIFANPGLPLTLVIFAFIEMADEVIISSCSMIVRRYFSWHGSAAGFFIASLGAFVLPAHFVVELGLHFYSERRILVRSLGVIVVSTCVLFNISGLMYDTIGFVTVGGAKERDIKNIELDGVKLKHILTAAGEVFYDWDHGKPIFIVFVSVLFLATIVLEGVDTSIMAKVTPRKLNEKFANAGLLATLIGTLGRVIADTILTVSVLLDINVFVDFVNATFLPVLTLAIACLFLVNRYYDGLA